MLRSCAHDSISLADESDASSTYVMKGSGASSPAALPMAGSVLAKVRLHSSTMDGN
jgi:hypothetical protein